MQNFHAIRKLTGRSIVFAALAWLVQPAVYAQSDAEILNSVRACQSVLDVLDRVDCYDSVLPPQVQMQVKADASKKDSGREVSIKEESIKAEPVKEDSKSIREKLASMIGKHDQNEQPEGKFAQIIEVQTPDLRTFRLIAEDGRVFSQSNAQTVIKWPQTPFRIEIINGVFGSFAFSFPGKHQRISVKLE